MSALAMTPHAVGVAVRRARARRSWTQSDLAESIGVTREWVGRLESGAPRLEFDKVLAAIDLLGLELITPGDENATSADIEAAEEIAWTMALEGRRLSARAFDNLLDTIVAERLAGEAAAPAP